jgi:putative ABC transport system permease protein
MNSPARPKPGYRARTLTRENLMSNSVAIIPLTSLLLSLLPAAIVIAVMYRWSLGGHAAVYGMARMIVQLIAVGYVLTFIFEAEHAAIVSVVLCIMLAAAAWIAIRPLRTRTRWLYGHSLAAIAVGGTVSLLTMTEGVLGLDRWFEPHVVVPLAGMAYSNAMNAVSLAAERLASVSVSAHAWPEARREAMNAAMIPVVNSLFAAGLVALPGMMTGQILSGVDPLLAVRYQIMVLAMVFAASGISAACYLLLAAGNHAGTGAESREYT